MKKLSGKIALITGGSQGIGESIAHHFSEAGAQVIVANRDQNKAANVVNSIKKKGGLAHARLLDCFDVESIAEFVSELKQSFSRIDILVNNAGTLVNKSIEDSTIEDWQRTMNVNLMSVFFLTKAIASMMKENRYGKIVTISSVADRRTFPNTSIYAISKAGLTMMSKVFAEEYSQYGINANVILPGNTATPINQHIQNNAEFVDWITKRTPSKRAYLTVDEVAKTALFLASDDASAIFGAEIAVDNGWLIGK